MIPYFGKTFENRLTVVPKILLEETICSPDFNRPSTVVNIAAIPDDVAMQRSPFSIAANRSSNTLTVGFVKREYILPSLSPAKRAAASAAFLKI